MDYNTLHDLYVQEIKDLASAEKQILRALPSIIRHTSSRPLRHVMEEHLKETQTHIERLDEILERLGKSCRGSKCRGVGGVLEEAQEWLDKEATAEVMDAGIIAAMQRVEHYEIAGYGCARTYASLLGYEQDEPLLAETLEEEHIADARLSAEAETINAAAANALKR